MGWSPQCLAKCLQTAHSPFPPLPKEATPDLSQVPPEYHDLCKSRATLLPLHRPYDCAIDLKPGTTPPRGRLFSLSRPEREAMEKYLTEAIAACLIRLSSSPTSASFFFVGKKDGTLRPCIDYRALNDITATNRYPLPLINTAFELLQDAQVFTKLDLRNAYHLVCIREDDEWKTAFNTPTGHWEYLVMPCGLTNAPAVFQALVNDVIRDMMNKSVFVYLDDILIFSSSPEEHTRYVRAILKSLLENRLFIKVEKCEFSCACTTFLGFIIENIRMDSEKVKGVTEWPTPTDRKSLQCFLGFANFYCRFIRNYSTITSSLTALSSPGMRRLRGPSPSSSPCLPQCQSLYTRTPGAVHRRGGRLQHRHRSGALSALLQGLQGTSLCLPVSSTVSSRAKLWHR